jgi:hypothetical protein
VPPPRPPRPRPAPRQAAKRVGAPGGFYVSLLSDANALGLPVSANMAEAALSAIGPADGAAFDAAWLLAAAHLPRPTRHMATLAMRSLAARGRRADAAAAGREFLAGGGELGPAGRRMLAELEAAAAAGGGAGGGPAAAQAVAAGADGPSAAV